MFLPLCVQCGCKGGRRHKKPNAATRWCGVRVSGGHLCRRQKHRPSRQAKTGSYQTRKNKGLSLEGICDTPMIPEWKLQMMANIIFRDFLNDKQRVLDIANSMLSEHIKDDDEKPDSGQLLADKKSELERLRRKRENLVNMRADDLISKDEFQKRLAPIDKEIGQAYNVIRELENAERHRNNLPLTHIGYE